MTLDEWKFSSRMAWENYWMRWISLGIAFSLIGTSVYSGFKLFSLSFPSGFVVTHYTVYLGIDQVLNAPWILAFILVPIALVFATILLGYGLFRSDVLASTACMIVAGITTLVWSIQLFYLIKINI